MCIYTDFLSAKVLCEKCCLALFYYCSSWCFFNTISHMTNQYVNQRIMSNTLSVCSSLPLPEREGPPPLIFCTAISFLQKHWHLLGLDPVISLLWEKTSCVFYHVNSVPVGSTE